MLVDLLEWSYELSEQSEKASTVQHLFDHLLHGNKRVLTRTCWKRLHATPRINIYPLAKEALEAYERWIIATVTDPRITFPAILSDNDEHLKGVLVLKDLVGVHKESMHALKAALASVLTFLESRSALNEMPEDTWKSVKQFISTSEYVNVEKEVLMERVEILHSSFRKASPKESSLLATKVTSKAKDSVLSSDESEPDDFGTDEQLEKSLGTTCIFQNHAMKQREPISTALDGTYSMQSIFGNNFEKVESYLKKRIASLLQVEDIIDCYLDNLFLCTGILTLAEVLDDQLTVTEALNNAAVLMSNFIRNALPLIERLLAFEPSILKLNLFHLSRKGLGTSTSTDRLIHDIVYKLRVLNGIFSGLDLHLFPKTIQAHEGSIRSISASSLDPSMVLTSGDDKLIRIWDLKKGQCLGLFAGHTSIIPWCRFVCEDQFVLSCSFDSTLKLWESKSGRCLTTYTGHTDSVIDADVNRDGKLFLSASMDGSVRLWGVHSGCCFRVYWGHVRDTWVKCVCFAPDGMGFFSGGLDKRINFWSLKADPQFSKKKVKDDENKSIYAPVMKPSQVWTDLHNDYVLDLAVLPSHLSPTRTPLLLTTSKDCTLQVVDLNNFGLLKTMHYSRSGEKRMWAGNVEFSKDGKYFVLGAFDNSVTIHSTPLGQLLRNIKVQNEGIQKVLFHHDNTSIIVATSSGKIQIIPI